ncbi:MAG TPA: glutathione S-transferase family protein [Kofleriaceae bacterium]|nr:glutathione S-transferase family protein [Kofleriaceae bacterium]
MSSAALQLIGTPLSHFTRKVRILLAELGVAHDFVRAPGVMGTATAPYGDHPLLRVPTLIDGAQTVIESDHIARYVVAHHDPDDRFGVRSEAVADLNWLAVVNGVMDNEVVWVLAGRGGLANLEEIVYFRKLMTAIEGGLAWLDRTVDVERARFDYGDIALICMWQHLAHYKLVPTLDRHARLAARVARFADRPSVAATTPERSLADARAAGWQPA